MTKGPTDTPESLHAAGDLESVAPAWTSVDVPDPNVINNSNEAFDVLFGGESEEWPEQSSSKGFRASWTVTVLVALLLLVSGLSLGAYLQRGHPSTSSTAAAGGRFGAGFPGAPGGASATGASSTASGVTSGTVTDIIGNTLYVTNASGALVAVKVTSAATIDRNASSSLSSLKPGDTVTVQGPTQKNGSVQAASVSATAKGVTTAGGFGGFGGGGGGFGGGAGGASSSSTTSGSSASAGG
jgi:hypothetical protein